jgi:hypothetical protein
MIYSENRRPLFGIMLYGACQTGTTHPMLLKIIAFISAAIPLVLFLRAMFGGRKTKVGAAVTEFRKQIDLAIYIFLGIIGAIVVFALGKLGWTWWTQL